MRWLEVAHHCVQHKGIPVTEVRVVEVVARGRSPALWQAAIRQVWCQRVEQLELLIDRQVNARNVLRGASGPRSRYGSSTIMF
jgi:hypothetical protein